MRFINFNLFIFLCLLPSFVEAQSQLFGTVKDQNNSFIAHVSLRFSGPKEFSMLLSNGQYQFKDLPLGQYKLTFTAKGYYSKTIDTNIGLDTLHQEIILLDSVPITSEPIHLKEVLVNGIQKDVSLKKSAIRTLVINTTQHVEQPNTLVEIINRQAGIHVRQTGGINGNNTVLINGFQQNAIRFFRDGIPADYLGLAYNIGLVPVDMLERVEVYKGVSPIELGADALGGVVNMVLKKQHKTAVNMTYEIASYGTHKASLYANIRAKNNINYGLRSFFNYSKNNYPVNIEASDKETANLVPMQVKLFHNTFRQIMTEAYISINKWSWADELDFNIAHFVIDMDNQFAPRMEQPYGASTAAQYSVIPSIKYRKFFRGNKGEISQFISYNTINSKLVDTIAGQFDWNNNFTPIPSRVGEISSRGALSSIANRQFNARTFIKYALSKTNELTLNIVYNQNNRTGLDPYGPKFKTSNKDILSEPVHLTKIVSGLSLKSQLFNNRMENIIILKNFNLRMKATDTDLYGDVGKEIKRDEKINRWGFVEALKYNINEASFLRTSIELASRLPDHTEFFGDGNLRLANLMIKPEKSMNINFGYSLQKRKISMETNAFYRYSDQLIVLVPLGFQNTQYQNVEKVKGWGVEFDMTYKFTQNARLFGNFTLQDLRIDAPENSTLHLARLRNTPYFFSNLGLQLDQINLGNKQTLDLYYFYSFVREYYFDYIPKNNEPSGFLGLWGSANIQAPNIIPNQNLHTVGITYHTMIKNLTLSLQVKNIVNKPIYDNFRIQNAGRTTSLKTSYTF